MKVKKESEDRTSDDVASESCSDSVMDTEAVAAPRQRRELKTKGESE